MSSEFTFGDNWCVREQEIHNRPEKSAYELTIHKSGEYEQEIHKSGAYELKVHKSGADELKIHKTGAKVMRTS